MSQILDNGALQDTFENRINSIIWFFAKLYFVVLTIPTLLYVAIFVPPSILNFYRPRLTLVDVFFVLLWLLGLGIAYKAARSPVICVRIENGTVDIRQEFPFSTRVEKIQASTVSVSAIRQIKDYAGNLVSVFSVSSGGGASYDLCPSPDRSIVEAYRTRFCSALARNAK